MKLGIGSGSTILYFVQELGKVVIRQLVICLIQPYIFILTHSAKSEGRELENHVRANIVPSTAIDY